MSDVITLSARNAITAGLDVQGVAADRLADLSGLEIAQLPVWSGRQRARLGDFFDVQGERATTLRIEGDLRHVRGLASGMSGGVIVIDGDAGADVAAGMSGGSVEVLGDVGDDAASGMSGGCLLVRGAAGHRAGGARPGAPRGMTGGEVVVHGDVGDDVAALCRRGLVVVGGRAGVRAGRAMIAGSLIVTGDIGEGAGQFNKRGSVIALAAIDLPATYRYACTYRPPHVRVTLTYIARRYGKSFDQRFVDGAYRRYCGDLPEPGRGEILVWTSS